MGWNVREDLEETVPTYFRVGVVLRRSLTKEQPFMESMECTGPSTVVIEELSDEEDDVRAITCKPRKRKRLLAIEGPSHNKGVSVEEEVTVMCSDDGLHQEEVVGTSVAEVGATCVNEVEDVQVGRE
ncbi:hypothetical protein EV1_037832 [Malus domestica]